MHVLGLIVLLTLAPTPPSSTSGSPTAPAALAPVPTCGCNVLFVCTGNYYRSRFAAAAFNAIAMAAGSGCRAGSRGLDISEPKPADVSPLVCDALADHGLNCSFAAGVPTALAQADLAAAAHIVVLEAAEHAEVLAARFDLARAGWIKFWAIPDGTANARLALPAIYAGVVQLHAALAGGCAAGAPQQNGALAPRRGSR